MKRTGRRRCAARRPAPVVRRRLADALAARAGARTAPAARRRRRSHPGRARGRNEDERYPSHLIEDHLKTWGPWCVYNTADERDDVHHVHHRRPARAVLEHAPGPHHADPRRREHHHRQSRHRLLRQGQGPRLRRGDGCAAPILGNTSLWTNLNLNLTTILQQYRVIMAGRPKLMVAITGYPNPYPEVARRRHQDRRAVRAPHRHDPDVHRALGAAAPRARADRPGFKKLNTTIENAVKPFAIGSGSRFVFVDTYTKLRDHCMKMEVEIKTTVEHPEEEGAVHEHDSPKVNFGCSDLVRRGRRRHQSPLPRSGGHRRPDQARARPRRAWASTRTTTATSASRT